MFKRPAPKVYTEAEAELYGRRRICWANGKHDLVTSTGNGGVQGISHAEARRRGVSVAACDQVKCRVCDVAFEASYPEIGQEVER
jgi:hypothetical protein